MQALTHDDFAAQLEQTFKLSHGELALDLSLIEATKLRERRDDEKRAPFSLLFQGPREPLLPQAIYRLENQAMGALDLFLVPVGGSETTMRYEAVFT